MHACRGALLLVDVIGLDYCTAARCILDNYLIVQVCKLIIVTVVEQSNDYGSPKQGGF